MIDLETYNFVKNNYGHFASWAVWGAEGDKPTDNVGDISVLDPTLNPSILEILNPHVILVGLNISGNIKTPLANFHAKTRTAKDFKIRYAFKETPYWGAYMTDIIKNFEQKSSHEMMKFLGKDKDFERKNIELFQEELKNIGSVNPVIVAFGNDAFKIIKRNFSDQYKLFKVPHYSAYMSKEKYRDQVKTILQFD